MARIANPMIRGFKSHPVLHASVVEWYTQRP